jgi:glycerol-3-phosphate O-acyltransferase / dihydroxyacetone phosphate acyltransferase
VSDSWLHRHTHGLTTFAARTYYRIQVAGTRIPQKGPALLVANHPNSLLDPALVASAADRPVRWLARAGLFEHRSIGWLIRGSGAIPVYRRDDSPDRVERNLAMFSAARQAILSGDAVGVFPEGLSHSEPSLAPLKTGAARIALGAGREGAGAFPILPVGLTFRGGKERFRSEALLLVGRPIRWSDLAGEGEESPEAVRELTHRIQEGLARVTVNLESWDDFPIVEGAEAIHHAEYGQGRSSNPVRWLARMRRTARVLEASRAVGREADDELGQQIVRHTRVLDTLGLHPRDLHHVPRATVAARWTLKNLAFFGLAAPLAILGAILFYPPWRLVRWAEPRYDLPPDKRATYKVLGGATACGGWVLLLAALLREFVGWRPALVALLLLPVLGLLTLAIRDRWREAVSDLRRFLVLRGRKDLRERLRERQAELASRIRDLQKALEAAEEAPQRPSPAPSSSSATTGRTGSDGSASRT